ncbi:putative deoxyribose-phosphate aldolase [Methanocella paludicola SANAE]|uniref:Deoxyribose-phosphate aldolase n=1 Tax=Methanocella paludicola (strain DSM 17711 / JCM 13418 / NBRC 101707 / SANAE) TaxID=304371 RepID=D1Z232_METPS|nr:deoxyribose-phosphate aldolase [Methanocella paludicola]BAI62754.1 putative deoxyribose-phosphate aldolase [Methanocella paludicola SANAE]
MDAREFARCIDHTLLRPDATEQDILNLCDEAVEYGFASACVASCWAGTAKKRLEDSGVKACCVVGFPFGSAAPYAKASEAWAAVDSGADEVDMVMNFGYLKSGMIGEIRRELTAVVAVTQGAAVKVIIETCYLTDEEKVLAARLVKDSGAAYVKTSTGYGPKGAAVEDVTLIKKEVPGIKIKASGGIRTYEDAKKFIDAGASRIGTSSGPKIVGGLR